MASQRASQRVRARRRREGGQRASEQTERYRFAQNVAGDGTVAEREYETYALSGAEDPRGDPDVLLDVPLVKVDLIHLQLDDLEAHVALQAKVLDLVRLNAGVDVHLGRLRIDIAGVEAQALLKARLDHVAAIVDRVLTTLDRNPQLVESLGRTVEQVGRGAGHALGETGEAVEHVGEGAGQAVGDVGQGAGQAVGDVGQGAGEAVGNLDETVQGVAQTAGHAVGQAGQGLGGLEQAVAGTLGGGGNGAGLGEIAGAARPRDVALLAAKLVAQQIKSAATEEAKELGLAATRKALEAGERRRQRKAEQLNATQAARREAEDLGVELERIEGSGPEGRITVRDVRQASEEE